MARAKDLEPHIQEIRNLLRSEDDSIVSTGLSKWEADCGDNFEIFLDILEGVLTTPLKRIYKSKQLRRDDAWWHENFAHNPMRFSALFYSFSAKRNILYWVCEKLQQYDAERYIAFSDYMKAEKKSAQIETLFSQVYHVIYHADGESKQDIDGFLVQLDTLLNLVTGQKKDDLLLDASRFLFNIGFPDVYRYLSQNPQNYRADNQADLLYDILADSRNVFTIDKQLAIKELVVNLSNRGTSRAVGLGSMIAESQPENTIKLFSSVLQRIRSGVYYGRKNQSDALCCMAYVLCSTINQTLPKKGKKLTHDIVVCAKEIFPYREVTLQEFHHEYERPWYHDLVEQEYDEETLYRHYVDKLVPYHVQTQIFFARLALVFYDSIVQDTYSILSSLMDRVFKGPSSLKETALKNIAWLFLTERPIVTHHSHEMKEGERILRDVITRDNWIKLLKNKLDEGERLVLSQALEQEHC